MKTLGNLFLIICAVSIGIILIGVIAGDDEPNRPASAGFQHSGTVSEHSVGCLAKADYDEFVTAARNKDLAQGQSLINGLRCFHIGGRRYSLVEQDWFLVQIRVYGDSGSVKLWTAMESIPR